MYSAMKGRKDGKKGGRREIIKQILNNKLGI